MSDEKEWYSAGEAAKLLGITRGRLAQIRQQGRIEGVPGGGKHVRYTMYHISKLRTVDLSDRRGRRSKSVA